MKSAVTHLYLIALSTTVLVAIFSYLNARRTHSKEFIHLCEFWSSLALMTVLALFFQSSNEDVVALSLLGWFWPLRTIILVVADITEKKLFSHSLLILPVLGGCLTLGLASFDLSFSYYTLPFTISIALFGFILIRKVFAHSDQRKYSLLAHSTFILLAVFFLVRLLFPFWRLNEGYLIFGLSAHIFSMVGLAVSTVSYNIEFMKEAHEKQLEDVIKERNEQLFGQSKYAELGMMSAGIAHEINNPLAIIQAKTTQLLRIYREPERQQELSDGLEQILYTSERINRTIQGVREFVHQDDRMPSEEFTLKTLVDDVLAFCGQRMKNHGINLRFYGIDNYVLHGHKIQLEQVLLNLLNNSFDAIEFLPDKWIEISAQDTGSTVKIFFKDSGPGIAPEIAKRLMDPFFTTKPIGKGTGLGLALARGIVERHGGVLIYVPKGPHTTFMIELPKNIEIFLPREETKNSLTMH